MMALSGDRNGAEGGTAAAGPVDPLPLVNAAESGFPIDRGVDQHYQWIETLAAGTSDSRYLARRLDTGALVELRVLSGDFARNDELMRAVRDHAARLARVPSPAIATVHECERTSSGTLVLAMEHPQGVTLRDTIRREGKLLAPERALHLALQIAEGLESAHNLGLVHGRLRPENVVLVDPGPKVVLTQFGLDRLLASGSPIDTTYQAPEQASGEATERSDIYSVGAVLYEMMAGTSPSPDGTFRRRLGPRLGRGISSSLQRVIARALDPIPDRRQPYMSVLCNDLSDELNLYRDRKAPHPTAVGKARAAWLAACVAFAVLGAVAFWHARPFATLPLSRHPSGSPSTAQMPGPPAAVTTPGPSGEAGPPDAGPQRTTAQRSGSFGAPAQPAGPPSTSAAERTPDPRAARKPQ
ncbi:MAG TPA: protein kinase, partial [Candidatus Methylomirabilis sp.]|nr:protein kinase [Candidatus Methylomirabilis sp.]